jgi:DNA polymerase (family X)
VSSPKQLFARELWDLAELEAAASVRRSFRGRAYRQAVWALDYLRADLSNPLEDVLDVPGIGEGVAGLIGRFRETGTIPRLDQLRIEFPADAAIIRRLPRMRPDMLRKLKTELGVQTVADLAAALETGAAETVPGIGPATVALWHDRLERELALPGLPVPLALSFARQLRDHIRCHVAGAQVALAGAVARLDERVAEIELATSSVEVAAFLEGSALVTGTDPGTRRFITLGGPVSIRHPDGTIAEASLEVDDLRGDLHRHSDWSPDGHDSIAAIVDGAIQRGFEYVAITDHAADLAFGGLSPDELQRQRLEITTLTKTHPDLLVLQGAELNIGRDGSVDYPDEILATLDFRLAAVHSYFDLPEPEQTQRVLTAIHNPLIHAIGHLTGRRIGYRPPIRLDMEAVLVAAAATSTALEINGHIDRLDLPAEYLPAAARLGVVFMANSDAHRHREWENLAHAVTLLNKSGVAAGQVVNTWPADRLRAWLLR